jgi:protein-glutamine gamma-glutamyltransferase
MSAGAGIDVSMSISRPSATDLRWLLFSLTLVMALHVQHFAIWVSVSILALGIWRYLIQYFHWQMPRIFILMPLTIFVGLGILLTYRGLFGRDASVELLAIMLMLKLMEAKTNRDFIIVIFGAYFLSITTFLFTQSMTYGVAMLLSTFALTATLIGISHPNGDLDWRFQSKMATSLMLQAAPIMLILFLLFPRIPGPLWGIPEDRHLGMSGLSDSMEPGDISELSLSGKVAFRAQFSGQPPSISKLYWRGPVLWHYDGRRWTMASPTLNLPNESLVTRGDAISYTITIEPSNRRTLLLLDMPVELPPDSSITRDFQTLAKQPIRKRMLYQASSHLDYTLGADVVDRVLELNLQIPDIDNPKTKALAQQWIDQGKSPEAIIEAALTMFREQDFIYTLRPDLLGQEPIDDFLFNTKRGFCEHYAGSFVYLMRAAGVPARVVIGYQGGELNPVGNYLIVRQSDAHAWAEVWLQDKGWVRIDPTGAVSPSRIESGIESAIPNENPLPLLARNQYPLLKQLYLNLDAIDNAWNHWVLGFDQKRQMELLSRLAGSKISWEDIAMAMIVSLAIVGSTLAFFLLKERPAKQDLTQRIYEKFLRKMQRRGLTRLSYEGPQDFSIRAGKQMPSKAVDIDRITKTYTELRYRDQHNMDSIKLFKQQVIRF